MLQSGPMAPAALPPALVPLPEGVSRGRGKRGRPPTYKSPIKFTIRAEEETLRKFTEKARAQGQSRTEAINELIADYLAS